MTELKQGRELQNCDFEKPVGGGLAGRVSAMSHDEKVEFFLGFTGILDLEEAEYLMGLVCDSANDMDVRIEAAKVIGLFGSGYDDSGIRRIIRGLITDEDVDDELKVHLFEAFSTMNVTGEDISFCAGLMQNAGDTLPRAAAFSLIRQNAHIPAAMTVLTGMKETDEFGGWAKRFLEEGWPR